MMLSRSLDTNDMWHLLRGGVATVNPKANHDT
ncbi:hypothetical protein COLO4_00024 [Corchorus olitorius]|uniref:Uncharacterized protein n=1 Tax=Corchorus olitorius TaxID=93759 RepID=A0A1R3L4T2_9ROSI|nr:hypothetical protein COLO4_00024 [Corchorus olitorius]